MQKLLMPFRKSIIECGYKTKGYKRDWGYEHYGIDITVTDGVPNPSAYDHTVYASGTGKVVWCKYDSSTSSASSLGWALAIQYDNCVGRDGSVKNLIARYMHCDKVYVSKGDTVTQGQRIAHESNVGTKVPHLHFEVDTDVNYPQYSPQVSNGHSAWVRGYRDERDTTLNPSLWLWQTASYATMPYVWPDKTYITSGVDDNIPTISPVGAVEAENIQLKQKITDLEKEIARLNAIIENVRKAVG